MKRRAYIAVHESRSTRGAGWYVGIAVEGARGYVCLAPGYGPYASYAAADWYANALNAGLGLSPQEAAEIVSSGSTTALTRHHS
jgi:hypothetical protein